MQTVITMTSVTCYKCGVVFGVSEEFDRTAHRDKRDFYCPNGHGQSYVESEADRLRKQLAQKEQELQQKAQEVQRVRAENYKLDDDNQKLRLKVDRIKHGVCTECNRTFLNLQRHMKTKHKRFVHSRKKRG